MAFLLVQKMLFFFVISLTVALGVRSENDCSIPPECSRGIDFQVKQIKFRMALKQVGDGLPSNEFFQENCDFLVEYLKCYRQGCGLRHLVIDLDALVNMAVEFCNEESAIRKAYVTHFDCFSSIPFSEDVCASSVMRVTEDAFLGYEISQSLEKNEIDRLCLFFYFIMTCAVDVTTATCGKEAGRAAADMLNRAMEVVVCNPNEMDFFSGIFEFSQVAQSAQKCNTTNVECSGEGAIIRIIQAQKVFPSEEDLQKYCSQVKEVLECPAEKAKECGERNNRENVLAYDELLKVFNDICEESSSFRASYLSNVPCYNSILDTFSECSYSAKEDVNRFMIDDIFSPLPFGTNAPLEYKCLAMDLIANCQIKQAAVSCGPQAAFTVGRLLLSLRDLSLSMHCKEPYMTVWRSDYVRYLTKSPEECEEKSSN